MTAPPLINLDDELKEFQRDLGALQNRLVQIRQLESNLWTQQSSLSLDITKRQKHLDFITKEAHNNSNTRIIQACKEQQLQNELNSIIKMRPIKIPILLWASLGTANYYLPDRHRIRYKQEYEKFKIQTVIIQLILAVIQYFWLEYAWLDALWYFFFFYSYSSILMREHILRFNGSDIKRWWIVHHYLCIGLSGVLLIWPNNQAYRQVRGSLLQFSIFTCCVQIMQYKYQIHRLYTMRAMSKINDLQITSDSDGAGSLLKSGLIFLVPFIIMVDIIELWFGLVFWRLSWIGGGTTNEWHIIVSSLLFWTMGIGNSSALLLTIWEKVRMTKKMPNQSRIIMPEYNYSSSSLKRE